MFYLKIAALAGAALFAFATGATAETATIKKRAGVTYSCTTYTNYEKCVRITLYKKNNKKDDIQSQVEWPVTYDTTSEKIHKEASRFIGLHEKVNNNVLKPLMNVNPVRTPWCAAFVNAVLEKTGFTGSGSLQARSFTNYGVKTTDPQKGDIVVMRTHVGFFEGYTYKDGKKYVIVLGGNQNNRVQVSEYPISKVIAYRKVV